MSVDAPREAGDREDSGDTPAGAREHSGEAIPVSAGDCECGGEYVARGGDTEREVAGMVSVACSSPACDWERTVPRDRVEAARQRARDQRNRGDSN